MSESEAIFDFCLFGWMVLARGKIGTGALFARCLLCYGFVPYGPALTATPRDI
jgi:hypothetical protein